MTSTANGTPRICGSYDAVAQSADLHLAIPLDPTPAGIVIRDQVLEFGLDPITFAITALRSTNALDLQIGIK